MTIEKKIQGKELTLVLEGRLDTLTAPELQKTLLAEADQYPEIVLDFAGVVYVSSAGLRVLLLGEKSVKKAKGKMMLDHVSAEILEVLRMTGFTKILTIRS